jgi:hypothetical protein
MIQLTLDPSIISMPKNSELDVSLLITGCSWGADTTTAIKKIEDLFPWEWGKPQAIRIEWVWKKNRKIKFTDITLVDPQASEPNTIKDLKEYYYKVISKEILDANGKIMLKEIAGKKPVKVQNIEFNDNTPENQTETNFFKAFIAGKAQELTPLNHALGFLFIGNDNAFSIPKDPDDPTNIVEGFYAFPYSKEEGSPWYFRSSNVPPASVPITQRKIYYASYQGKDKLQMEAFCPYTALPKQITTPRIQLRDMNGNFDGSVKLHVTDIENWIPNVMNVVSEYVNLPDWFAGFLNLKESRARILCSTATPVDKYLEWIKELNVFLCATARDTMGFGLNKTLENSNSIQAIVTAYLKDDFWGAQYSNIYDYNEAYDKVYGELEKNLVDPDKNENWMGVIDYLTSKDGINKKGEVIKEEIKNLVKRLIPDIKVTDPADVVNERVSDWLDAWTFFLNNREAQEAMIAAQWVVITANFKDTKDFFKDKFSSKTEEELEKEKYEWVMKALLSAGDMRGEQKKAIVTAYKDILVDDVDLKKPGELKDNARKLIKAYVTNRILPQPPKAIKLYPLTGNPLAKPPAGVSKPLTWKEFEDYIIAELNKAGQNNIDVEVDEQIQITYGDVSKLFIGVDTFGSQQTQETSVDDVDKDLNDEIAGHILLMRRADTLGKKDFSKEWYYLNKAIVNLVSVKKADTTCSYDPKTLPGNFVVPINPGENFENKIPYLKLANEKLSLIAAHTKYNDGSQGSDCKDYFPHFRYEFDKSYKAPALFYGYHYQFAGFVALNSGVLPGSLRGTALNVPAEKPNIKTGEISEYEHYRRVPVSGINMEAERVLSTEKKPTLKLPLGLNPLAFELPEWKGHKAFSNEVASELLPQVETKSDQNLFLLANTTDFKQDHIRLTFERPTVSFWNWFAWMGKEMDKAHLVNNKPVIVKDKDGKEIEQTLGMKANMIYEYSKIPKEKRVLKMNDKLRDPAVDSVGISIQQVFPMYEEPGEIIALSLTQKNYFGEDKIQLEVQVNKDRKDKEPDYEFSGGKIIVKEGIVLRIKVYTGVKSEYFDESTGKFWSWMKEGMPQYNGFHYFSPREFWFESAIQSLLTPEELWESIRINQESDKVMAGIDRKDFSKQMAYLSRIEISHQVWNWNGRIDEGYKTLDPDSCNPKKDMYTTTYAMKWEAWAFSDRPDYSSVVAENSLLAFREPSQKNTDIQGFTQVLFTDHRPKEQKALYYRFSLKAYSRYELLKDKFRSILSEIEIKDPSGKKTKNPWKRYIRRCSRTLQLPKPSIRFVIPLTKAYGSTGTDAAPFLVVLNSPWFTEAGLADKLEIGIPVLSDPNIPENEYVNAGYDPILSGNSLGKLKSDTAEGLYVETFGKKRMLVLEPGGVAGLTFDFNAQVPKVNDTAFVLNAPDLSSILDKAGKLDSWSMMQIAVRRAVIPELCEGGTESKEALKSLTSEWTAMEWVQFLSSMDRFIPEYWKHKLQADAELTKEDVLLTDLPAIEEDEHIRYLLVTERVSDISGQPCEKYIGTFRFMKEEGGTAHVLVINDGTTEFKDLKFTNGYIRLLVVRKVRGQDKDNDLVWKKLFGNSVTGNVDMNKIENDASAALPFISERMPFINL